MSDTPPIGLLLTEFDCRSLASFLMAIGYIGQDHSHVRVIADAVYSVCGPEFVDQISTGRSKRKNDAQFVAPSPA